MLAANLPLKSFSFGLRTFTSGSGGAQENELVDDHCNNDDKHRPHGRRPLSQERPPALFAPGHDSGRDRAKQGNGSEREAERQGDAALAQGNQRSRKTDQDGRHTDQAVDRSGKLGPIAFLIEKPAGQPARERPAYEKKETQEYERNSQDNGFGLQKKRDRP
jgi:hypothetical protein